MRVKRIDNSDFDMGTSFMDVCLDAARRELLEGTSSTLERLAMLSSRRERRASEHYRHDRLFALLGPDVASRTIALHELVWRDWVATSLEQQKREFFAYLRNWPPQEYALLTLWQQTEAFLAFVPPSASPLDRELFLKTVVLFLLMLVPDSHLQSSNASWQGDQAAFTDRMLHFLAENYTDQTFSLKRLSHLMNVSERHMVRLFKRHTGKTFREYLLERRMQTSAHLLETSPLAIKTIAHTVGYCHASHFGTDFRLWAGCTPVAFRDAARLKPVASRSETDGTALAS